jgi:hypothetical protein
MANEEKKQVNNISGTCARFVQAYTFTFSA